MRAVHWFRSDLRLRDNTALAHAATRADSLIPVFVLDPALHAERLEGAARMRFLLDGLAALRADLERRGSTLVLLEGRAETLLPRFAAEQEVQLVTWNRDYSPFARRRDAVVAEALGEAGIAVSHHKDRVMRESEEVLSQQNRPFAVYSPYRKVWWRRYEEDPPARPAPLRIPELPGGIESGHVPGAADLGIDGDPTAIPKAGEAAALRRLKRFLDEDVHRYSDARDLPGADATSRLSPYLRFGMLSIRRCFQDARALQAEHPKSRSDIQKWMDELVWREFNHAILSEHPRVLRRAYRAEYDDMRWDDDEEHFAAWCTGRTGYPFVDAGMRELLATGFMHNRVRMVVASFLTKDLLIDWRWGERFFMKHLVDGDPANNNMGWQWAASTGTDAQPYFRIFNPVTQGERFDPDGEYIRRWIPELAHATGKVVHQPWTAPLETAGYPAPIVDHSERRARALARFQEVRDRAGSA